MDHAHGQGVIHRDLRPGNVIVTDAGVAKVTDFGTSRFLEIAAHGTTVIGSPPYMAPEQFHGKAVFASDVYSIGVTMYQLLTGRLPYEAPEPDDLEKLERGELTTSPRLHNPKIPKAISDIVLKAMAPDITARYARAHDLLDAILAARPHAAGRRPWPAAAAAGGAARASRPGRTSANGSRPARRRLHGSAGTVASRCPPAPAPVPFCGEAQ